MQLHELQFIHEREFGGCVLNYIIFVMFLLFRDELYGLFNLYKNDFYSYNQKLLKKLF